MVDSKNWKDTNPKEAFGCRKVSMSVVPGTVLMEIALGMMEGAIKYRSHNYRVSGVSARTYYDAAERHLLDWWEGQDIDPKSGLNHITKAITSLVVLRDAMIQGMWVDDRPPPTKDSEWMESMNKFAEELLDRYEEHLPPYTKADLEAK